MSPTVVNYIRSALAWVALGVILGALMNIVPDWTPFLKTAHAHINLVGWVSMFIFGVGYHILPRFRGRPLHSESLATTQLWLANIGLAGMVVFTALLNSQGGDVLRGLVVIFSVVTALAFLIFVYNLGRTMG